MLKVLELFGGIGACSKALENLNIDYEIADYVEIDKYAVASFNAIHNTSFQPQDICQWDKDIEVDLIMHGSPCQDFSLAGKQAGGDEGSGTRSSLMFETIRIVDKLKPKYVIWENVKNLLSKNHRHNFDSYLEKMESLGYKNYYQVLNAKDYGIPQNRERVFTVSIRNDITIDKTVKPSVAVNFEREKENIIKSDKEIYQCECESGWQDNKVGLKVSPTIRANNNNTFILEDNRHFEFPPKQELKLKLKDMLEENVDEKYYLSDTQIKRIETTTYNVGKTRIQKKDWCDTLCARDWKDPKCVEIKEATKKGYLEAEEGDGVDISSRMQHHRGTVQKEMIQTLDSQGGNSKGVVIKKDTPNYIEWEEEGKFESDCRAYKEDKISGAIVSTPKNKVLLKEKLCNELIEQGMVEENDVIRHSYSNSRMNNFYKQNSANNNVSPTLDTRCDCLGVTVKTIGNYSPSNHNASRVVDNDGLAPTVMENHGTVTATQDQLRIRKLTPKECWRLMGFDDEDFEKASQVNSNAQLYKQAGNSIVVNVLENILKNLL